MEDLFGEGKIIRIEAMYGDTVERYMRFLKVKELPEFYRINEIKDERERTLALIAMIKEKVEGEIDSLPANDIRDAFIDINFGSAPTSETVGAQGPVPLLHNLVNAFDFLISQGHSFSAIMEYTLPRYRLLIDAACERVFGKKEKPKKMDPLEAFQKLGFRIRRKSKDN